MNEQVESNRYRNNVDIINYIVDVVRVEGTNRMSDDRGRVRTVPKTAKTRE